MMKNYIIIHFRNIFYTKDRDGNLIHLNTDLLKDLWNLFQKEKLHIIIVCNLLSQPSIHTILEKAGLDEGLVTSFTECPTSDGLKQALHNITHPINYQNTLCLFPDAWNPKNNLGYNAQGYQTIFISPEAVNKEFILRTIKGEKHDNAIKAIVIENAGLLEQIKTMDVWKEIMGYNVNIYVNTQAGEAIPDELNVHIIATDGRENFCDILSKVMGDEECQQTNVVVITNDMRERKNTTLDYCGTTLPSGIDDRHPRFHSTLFDVKNSMERDKALATKESFKTQNFRVFDLSNLNQLVELLKTPQACADEIAIETPSPAAKIPADTSTTSTSYLDKFLQLSKAQTDHRHQLTSGTTRITKTSSLPTPPKHSFHTTRLLEEDTATQQKDTIGKD